MPNFLITKRSEDTILGTFSNLKYAVNCLLKMGAKTNYDYVYRRMRHSNGGTFVDLDDFRITKLLQNNVYQYENGKLVGELVIKAEEE